MMQAELLNYELGQIEQELQELDKKHEEVEQLRASLSDYETIETGKELFVPLAPGIFTKAMSVPDKTLLVNVGQGVVVKREPEHVAEMLSGQLEQMEAHQKELQALFEEKLATLQKMETQCSDS